ncbi:MAG: phytanoyl-CoA dioxygenase family protein, partial [Actinomycetes bacterium]
MARLGPLWEDLVPGLFVDHRPVFCTFVVKHPGVESQMGLHEDQSWVDETRFRSGTMWVPLTDVGPSTRNGALGVVPGSHRLALSPCGAGSPYLTAPYERGLADLVVVPEMAAGSGLFYDSRTLHGSSANESDEPRVALACGIVPSAADLRYVRATGRRGRTVFAVDEQFYLDHSPRQLVDAMPTGYEQVEQYVDELGLDPAQVGELLGLGRPVPADPVVPWAVHPSDEPLPPLRTSAGGRAVTADLDPGAPAGPLGLPGWTVTVATGAAGRVADGVRDALSGDLRLTGQDVVAVVAPYSQCELLPGAGATPVRLEVVDAA